MIISCSFLRKGVVISDTHTVIMEHDFRNPYSIIDTFTAEVKVVSQGVVLSSQGKYSENQTPWGIF